MRKRIIDLFFVLTFTISFIILFCCIVLLTGNYHQREIVYNALSIFQKQIDLEQEFNALPDSSQEILKNENYTFIISNANDLRMELNENVEQNKTVVTEGYTDYQTKTIVLSHNPRFAKNAYIHEVGHAIDHYEKISDTEEWQQIYKEESIVGTYGAISPAEFFAETYKSVVIGKPLDKTPAANEFVTNIIKK